ncbi:uncharacterized protein [Diadema antillarum]|uniref:uncharacterized protein n=1 Tax=Diadema antillarum TaxID=105358 RepID=UPI003A86CA84
MDYLCASSVRVFLATVAVIYPVLSAESLGTEIGNKGAWTVMEGSNITLDCQVFTYATTDISSVCGRVEFTLNSAILAASDARHVRGGPYPWSGSVNCTLTILELTVEEGGDYGCCWPDLSDGECGPHIKKTLLVLPVTTTPETHTTVAVTTWLPTTTSKSTTTMTPTTKAETTTEAEQEKTSRRHTTNNPFGKVSPHIKNEAQRQTPIHRTVWPLLLTIAVVVVLVILVVRYCKMRAKGVGGKEPVPAADPDGPGHYGTAAEELSLASNGVTVTTDPRIIDLSDDSER